MPEPHWHVITPKTVWRNNQTGRTGLLGSFWTARGLEITSVFGVGEDLFSAVRIFQHSGLVSSAILPESAAQKKPVDPVNLVRRHFESLALVC
jgi:hypothetical protein